MLKKLLTGILIGLLAFGAMYLYFFYTGDPSVVLNRIQTYQLYTAIFFVSIVAIYMLQGSNKLFNFLIFVIVVINMFILGDTFFRNNIGLNSDQFLTLFGLLLVALAVTYITHWIRYILMGIVGLGIIFVLLTGMLPLYENIPSINDFIQSQKTNIVNLGTNNEGILTIKNALGTKEIPINEITKNDIDLSQKTQISFSAKTQSAVEKIFIDLGNGSFININPQSAITLQQSGNTTIMQILQGNVAYYMPPELTGALQLIGKYQGKSIQNIKDDIRGNLTAQFEQKKQEFFINQLGGSMVLNPAIDKVIKGFINTLYTISPKTYQKNLVNYTTIQQYLGKSITGSISTSLTGENLQSIINDMISQAKRGFGETQISQRLQ